MDDAYEFGKWLRNELKKREITQAQIVRETGVSRLTLQKLFAKERKPRLDTVILILDALGKRIEIVDK